MSNENGFKPNIDDLPPRPATKGESIIIEIEERPVVPMAPREPTVGRVTVPPPPPRPAAKLADKAMGAKAPGVLEEQKSRRHRPSWLDFSIAIVLAFVAGFIVSSIVRTAPSEKSSQQMQKISPSSESVVPKAPTVKTAPAKKIMSGEVKTSLEINDNLVVEPDTGTAME